MMAGRKRITKIRNTCKIDVLHNFIPEEHCYIKLSTAR